MFTKIASTANPTIKMLKSLHLKKARGETGLFLAEGARLAGEAAELGHWPEILAVASVGLERPRVRELAARAEAHGVRVLETSEAVLAGISKKDNPQTMIGAYRQRFATLDALRPQSPALVVALESVRDPGNFGTIVRTADAAGCDAVVLLGACCDPFSVEAVRATMGSIFAAPIVRTELGAFDAWRRARGMTLIGGSLNGKAPDDTLDVAGDTALLMGNEQAGLTDEAEAACDRLVQIPMRGRADSLNLAIATGVLIYDVWRRRDYAGAR